MRTEWEMGKACVLMNGEEEELKLDSPNDGRCCWLQSLHCLGVKLPLFPNHFPYAFLNCNLQ